MSGFLHLAQSAEILLQASDLVKLKHPSNPFWETAALVGKIQRSHTVDIYKQQIRSQKSHESDLSHVCTYRY